MWQWKEYSKLEGTHAFLGASKHSWINYDDEKFIQTYLNWKAVQRGTLLHDLARRCIELERKQPRNNDTFNMYVNDALGFHMKPEQILYYSPYCYGTADAIQFKESRGQLRIHDLKTGVTPASLHQLEIYAAQFCLNYDIKPGDIETELRIYQNNDVLIGNPPPEVILPIMDKIVRFNNIITDIEEGE